MLCTLAAVSCAFGLCLVSVNLPFTPLQMKIYMAMKEFTKSNTSDFPQHVNGKRCTAYIFQAL